MWYAVQFKASALEMPSAQAITNILERELAIGVHECTVVETSDLPRDFVR